MKKLAVLTLCLLAAALALATPPADAGCRRVVQTSVTPIVAHRAAVVVETPLVTSFLVTPQPVFPVYGVGLGYGANDSQSAAEIRLLTAELARLRETLTKPGTGPTPAPNPTPGPMPKAEANSSPMADAKLSLALASCTRCHSGPAAKGGITLTAVDGTPLPHVPLAIRLRAFKAIATERMPPNGPAVSNEAFEALARWSDAAD